MPGLDRRLAADPDEGGAAVSNRTEQWRGLADMSLPPVLRRRRARRRRGTLGVPAQMDHGANARSRKRAREGERKLAAERQP
jgi:hypothetical protein